MSMSPLVDKVGIQVGLSILKDPFSLKRLDTEQYHLALFLFTYLKVYEDYCIVVFQSQK